MKWKSNEEQSKKKYRKTCAYTWKVDPTSIQLFPKEENIKWKRTNIFICDTRIFKKNLKQDLEAFEGQSAFQWKSIYNDIHKEINS